MTALLALSWWRHSREASAQPPLCVSGRGEGRCPQQGAADDQTEAD